MCVAEGSWGWWLPVLHTYFVIYIFLSLKDFIHLLLERGEGKEKERERNINVCLPLICPLLGTLPKTQACALTGNGASDPLVCRPTLNPLSYTSQGCYISYFMTNQSQILSTNINISTFLSLKHLFSLCPGSMPPTCKKGILTLWLDKNVHLFFSCHFHGNQQP